MPELITIEGKTPIEKIKSMMEYLKDLCEENKVGVELEAAFEKKDESMQYLWVLKEK